MDLPPVRVVWELIPYVGAICLVAVLVRAGWRWWSAQPSRIAGLGLVVAAGTTAGGWVFVGLVHASHRISSENFIWLLVGPGLLIFGILVVCAGVLGAVFGAMAVATALRPAPDRRGLVAFAGAGLAVLNLAHVVRLVRLLYTG